MTNPLAPERTPAPPATELSPVRRRFLADLVAHPDSAILDVTNRVGSHANTARLHLDALVAEGFACAEPRVQGPGRPAVHYSPTAHGRAAAQDTSGIGAEEATARLVRVILDAVAAQDDPERTAHDIGRHWGESQRAVGAGTNDPRADVEAVLARDGYAPVRRGDDLVLLRCPLLGLATEYPRVICALHAGLLAGLTDSTGAAPNAVLEPFAADDGCVCRFPAQRTDT